MIPNPPRAPTHAEAQAIKERWRQAELQWMREASMEDLKRWKAWREEAK